MKRIVKYKTIKCTAFKYESMTSYVIHAKLSETKIHRKKKSLLEENLIWSDLFMSWAHCKVGFVHGVIPRHQRARCIRGLTRKRHITPLVSDVNRWSHWLIIDDRNDISAPHPKLKLTEEVSHSSWKDPHQLKDHNVSNLNNLKGIDKPKKN